MFIYVYERGLNMFEEEKEIKSEGASRSIWSRISEMINFPGIFMVLGLTGLTITGILMFRLYSNTNNVKDLMMPLVLYFIPFTAAFMLLRFGMREYLKKKR
jgi:hypothetical protein